MPKATADDILKVKAANPGTDIYITEHPTLPHDFLVHGPGSSLWNIYRQKANSDVDGEKLQAEQMLYDACVVWPEKGKERDDLCEKYPALVTVVVGELVEIAGATKAASHRKL
jgi:hypothetical protein